MNLSSSNSFLKSQPTFPILLHLHSQTMKKPFSIFLISTLFLVFILTKFSLVFSIDAATTANLPLQLISLLSLKSSLKDPFNTFRDWDPNPTLSGHGFKPLWCLWSGVKCDDNESGRVTGLDLSGRNLSGAIPVDFPYLLHLHHLNLSGNQFDGPLPPVIFEISFLRTLDFSNNSFNSTFPPRISRLKYLTHLNGFSNNFVGPLPGEIVRLRNLEYLNLGGSYFSGEIPASYGSFQKLKFLYLAGNLLTGPIPPELGLLNSLENLQLGYNDFTGELPIQLFTLSNLTFLDISQANISGDLSPQICNLTNLEILYLFKNHLTGTIPEEISRLTLLKELDLSNNYLWGAIPASLSSLDKLSVLSLMNNNLTGEIPSGIGELPNLERLSLWNNSLSGILPQQLGSNSRLEKLDVSSNSLSGQIPPNLCLGNRLNKLILFSNQLSGNLPWSLANCTALNRLRVQKNKLNGSIPLGFGFLPNFTFMDISNNVFSGAIPKDLGNAAKLEFLNISENPFNAGLPDNIWSAPNLKIFSASYSALNGKIPDFRGCQSLYKIELEGNNLTGDIPWDIHHCEKLISLNFRGNSLTGIIPWEISTLPSITDVDLSRNLLTGTVPSNFGSCRTLESFNVSYNQLTGPLPSSGPIFSSLHPSSFAGNEGLCGGAIQRPCRPESASGVAVKLQPKKTAGAIVWIIAAAFGICLFVLIAACRYFHANYRRRFHGDRDAGPWKLTAFQRLNFTAEDVLECLSLSNKVIGSGSTGTVYKVEMPGGEIIAVKKLWGIQNDAVRRKRGVLAEVEVLGKIRHRNIVRLLGCCTNNQATMLLYEYMPNGSLDDLLHGTNKGINVIADWITRYKIALGVAQGICYLHHDCDPVIIHRDLKPSNILLDSKIEVRIADFGVAKLVQNDESMSIIAGSYGYIAPEYAYSLQVDVKSDIYSYGVVLMEILTGKRSMDPEFGEGNSVVDWVRYKLKVRDGVTDVLDKNAGASCPLVREEMMLLLRIAMLCTSRNPADRPSMRDVVSMLQEAKPKRKLATGSGESGGNGGVISNCIQKTTIEC